MKASYLLYDGQCKFCTGWATFLKRYNRSQNFEIISAHDPEGDRLVQKNQLSHLVPSTIIYINENEVCIKSDAIFAALSHTRLRWLNFLKVFPRSWRNRIYDFISENRLLFGSPSCEC